MRSIPKLDLGKFYHIYNRGNNREDIFVEERNYGYFLDLYAKYIVPIANTYSYSLLRNHFHFAIRTKTEEEQEDYWKTCEVSKTSQVFHLKDPSHQFANFFNAYAKAINKAYNRTGSLCQERFGRKEIITLPYLLRLIHYIHFNPQRHRLAEDFRLYRFSSYQTFLSEKPTQIERSEVLKWFGGRESFCEFHNSMVQENDIESLGIDEDF